MAFRCEVEKLEEATTRDEQATRQEKAKIEEELGQIQPILDAAKKAVGSIKQDHINEIRSLKMPPDPIHDVLSGVLRVMKTTICLKGSIGDVGQSALAVRRTPIFTKDFIGCQNCALIRSIPNLSTRGPTSGSAFRKP